MAVKFTLEQGTKTQSVSKGRWLYSFFNLGIMWAGDQRNTPAALPPLEDPVLIVL
jgi:hypothetical protein